MTTLYPVIMCGGSGTRLWPVSVIDKPKQFHAIVTENSMLQETIARADAAGDLNVAPPSFVCALSHEALIREQCKALGIEPLTIILEPCPRNTAPVAAVIALEIGKIDPEGLVLLLPADHHIEKPEAFWAAVEKGMPSAQSDYLTTFGIKPSRAETGYGYIQAGDPLGDQCVDVARFVEKPDKITAQKYLDEGGYFWNGGIFLFSPSAMQSAFSAHAADILASSKATLNASTRKGSSVYLDPVQFSECRSESIDYAIMEHAEKVAMVCPVDIGWTDIGSWEAVRDYRIAETGEGAATSGETFTLDCSNTLVRSDGPYVAAIGLTDIIVVATKEAVLVTKSDQTQDVKKIVQSLKDSKRTELL